MPISTSATNVMCRMYQPGFHCLRIDFGCKVTTFSNTSYAFFIYFTQNSTFRTIIVDFYPFRMIFYTLKFNIHSHFSTLFAQTDKSDLRIFTFKIQCLHGQIERTPTHTSNQTPNTFTPPQMTAATSLDDLQPLIISG